jgi:hypothetical protein
MLRVIHISNGALPVSYPVHPTAEFQPGMIAQLTILGNDIMSTVSDGTAPFGIIDDCRTNAFTAPQIDEIVEIILDEDEVEIDINGYRVNKKDAVGYLKYPNILEKSFVSDLSIMLNAVNGVVIVPAGTRLNYASTESGILDGYKIICTYIYRIANKPGDDSTIGSNRVTIYYQRGIYATDQFDTRQIYPLNATLYVGMDGRLTTEQPTPDHPGIAVVTGPPSSVEGTLEFLWL